MIIVDAHCDTLTKVIDTRSSLWNNSFHWDVKRAMEYGGFVQVLAVFQDPDISKPTFQKAMMYLHEAKKLEEQLPAIKLCSTYRDMEDGLNRKKVCCLLSIEGGEALEGKSENLQAFYNAGVRMMTLTWNYSNELGDGAKGSGNGGLTPFGRNIIRFMQEKGIIIDISHADEKTFYDCMSECRGPLVASHSNANAVHRNPRNLRDAQILEIAKRHGVIGVNFYTDFIQGANCTVTALVRHIEHICKVGGEDTVGLGADFDGMQSLPMHFRGVQDLGALFNELARLNYPDRVIQKIAGRNFLRVFHDVLQSEKK